MEPVRSNRHGAPKISVVTPSFNQGATIEATIRSVLEQDYPHFEHFVMDGGSTDETVAVLERYPHLQWVSEPDRGQTHAINKGLARASGEIFAYLNSDDVYRPGAFAAAAEAFADPAVDVLAGDCDIIDAAGRSTGVYRARMARPEDLLRYWEWDRAVCLPQPSAFWRRRVLDEVGGFDESFDMAMDYEIWLRLARRGAIHTLPRTLAAYRDTADNKTNSRRGDMILESNRAARKHLSLAPGGRRLGLWLELRRQTAGHLLTVAAEQARRDLAWRALGSWPLIGHSPRLWRALLGGSS